MKVAIPVWQSRISPVFDVARRLLVLDIEKGQEVSRSEYFMDNFFSDAQVRVLRELNVDVLLCGAISRQLAGEMTDSGIEVVSFLTGPVDELLDHYLSQGAVEGRFLMPGCHRCRHRFRGARGNARGGEYQQNAEEARQP